MKRYPQYAIQSPTLVLLIWGAILAVMALLVVVSPTLGFGPSLTHDRVVHGALACALLLVAVWIVFRKGQAIVFALLNAACGIAVSYGLMSLFGVEVTLPLGAMAVCLIVIGLQYAVHVGHAYTFQTLQERYPGHPIRDKKYLLSEAARGARSALVLSAVATMAAFLSIKIASPVPEVARMGAFLCVGTLVLVIAALTVVPAILALWPWEVAPAQETGHVTRLCEAIGDSAIRRPGLHVAIMVAIVSIAAVGALRLRSDTDVTQYSLPFLLGIACVVAALMTLIFLTSVKLGLLSLVTTAIPLGTSYAILGLIGRPLDATAAVTGALLLALAIDDTSHLLWTWLRFIKQKGETSSGAVRGAMREVGPPMIMKWLVVAFGLAWTGSFMLVSIASLVAWNLLVTPALLRLTKFVVPKPTAEEAREAKRINKSKLDPKRRYFSDYTDEEIATVTAYDYLALAGVTVIRQGGSHGTRRLLYEMDLQPGEKLLEFGSGVGGNAFELHEHYKVHTHGTDLSAFMVEHANRRSKERGLSEFCKFEQCTDERLPYDDNTFDVVLVEAVVMYTDSRKTLSEMFRVLKPGGRLGFHDWSWTIKPDESMEVLTNLVACGCNPEDVKFFSKADWEKVLRKRGFDIQYSQEFPFDFFAWHAMSDAEGVWGTLKVFGRVMSRMAAFKRLLAIISFLSKYEGNIGYVIMTAQKPLGAVASPPDDEENAMCTRPTGPTTSWPSSRVGSASPASR